MKKIAVMNQKGGVGKTLTTLCLAYNLASKNKKTLIVDADKQANSTVAIIDGASVEEYEDYNLYNVLASKEKVEENTLELNEYLSLLQATPELAKVQGTIHDLESAMNEIKEKFEYVIVDTGPQLDKLNIMAITAADLIVIPTSLDKFGLKAVKDAIGIIESIRVDNMPNFVILPNLYDARIRRKVEYFAKIKELYGDKVLKAVPLRASLAEITENEDDRLRKRDKPLQHYKNLTNFVIENM